MVTGTGMRGELEDGLNNRIARIFGPPVPVLVHRYGLIRSGALFERCQRAAARRLVERLRQFRDDNDSEAQRPDIIAHSFGAWLVGEALRQNPDLRVGRIILAGSVIRPDFDWNSLITSGRVEAVLNHYGRRDLWAWVSEYFIPRSGPSGFRGFAESSGVFNCVELDFRHTTFFESEYIDDVHERLWRPFLTRPVGELQQLSRPGESRAWRPLPWVLRSNLLRLLLLIAVAAGATELLLTAARLVTGLVS